MKLITAQALYNLTRCPHRVYLDANGDPQEKGEVNSFVKLLWELGLQTEREYMSSLGDFTVADLQPLSVEVAASETLRLMQEGVPLIYQGCLHDPPYIGRPDLLVKRDNLPSRLGTYGYEAIDIKAGKGWEQVGDTKKKFKTHYAYQILFYRMLLQRIQGVSADKGRIVNVNKEVEEFEPEAFESDFEEALLQAKQLVEGEETSEPVLSSQCYLCDWFTRCENWVRERSDPTNLFFVGKQKFHLKRVGLQTVEDIAKMEVKDYLGPDKKIPRMGEKALRRMKQRAQVCLAREPLIRPGYGFPPSRREVYFDIEDDPTRGTTYLFGLVIKESNAPLRYEYFLAKHPEEEEAAVRAFWNYLSSEEDETYYVYSHKERTSLKQLMDRYSLDPQVFDRYVRNEYDLYTKLIVEYSDWPTFSYSIKHIAKLVGFRWRDPDPSGANSIAWFNDYLENPSNESVLHRILRYNEDDCLAMLAIKQFFENRAGKNLIDLGEKQENVRNTKSGSKPS
ncbi:MAG: TM0106 family RecB-like putative nuclease [Nitrospirales bacterium]|nr:TM0106 family RecB-like putative nuclease [Nitrospirales bacterium]